MAFPTFFDKLYVLLLRTSRLSISINTISEATGHDADGVVAWIPTIDHDNLRINIKSYSCICCQLMLQLLLIILSCNVSQCSYLIISVHVQMRGMVDTYIDILVAADTQQHILPVAIVVAGPIREDLKNIALEAQTERQGINNQGPHSRLLQFKSSHTNSFHNCKIFAAERSRGIEKASTKYLVILL